MIDTGNQPEGSSGAGIKPWQGRLISGLLIAVGILHAVKPKWLKLDWPSIATIFVGIVLLFVPLNNIGGVIESLEIGKTKILFRKVKSLDESVDDAEKQEVSTSKLMLPMEFAARPRDEVDDIEAALSDDKEVALIRIGIEIERVLTDLYQNAGGYVPPNGIIWSKTTQFLVNKGDLSPATSRACIEFRNVRNQLIHPSGGKVADELVVSALDSGIKLLRLLTNIRDMKSAETGWLSPELAIGIRRVKGVKRLGRKMGNWLTRNQAQDLVNATSKTNLRGWRDGAMVALLLGCGLRRSEVVGLNFDQLQSREGHWVIVNLVGKGARLRTVPVPSGCKDLVDAWLRHSGVSDGKVFRQVSKGGILQPSGVTANVVWYAVKRCAGQVGISNLAPHDLRRTCARLCHGSGGELEQIQFLLGHASVQTTERYIGSKQKLQDAVNDRLGISVASDSA